jgi:hypothetical protein
MKPAPIKGGNTEMLSEVNENEQQLTILYGSLAGFIDFWTDVLRSHPSYFMN